MLFWIGVLICLATSTLAQNWTVTGSLTYARNAHTATLLTDGNVIVAAGYDGSIVINSAELYNATTGLWTVTGSLATAREWHTATLLANGNVLVAAGDDGPLLNSAELYNATTGLWTVTGSLTNARNEHTATLLPNGNVLVAGGGGTNGPLNSAELYNAATGLWTVSGSLTFARCWHTATLLTNGNVLVTGGFSSFDNSMYDTISTCELFNLTTGQWRTTGSMTIVRQSHTATLLINGLVLVAAGWANNVWFTSCELFNPTIGQWTTIVNLTTPRSQHTATILQNGFVLVAGGWYNNIPINSSELLNTTTGQWTTLFMEAARSVHTAALIGNGLVMVAGGAGNTGVLNSAELFVYEIPTPTATSTPTPTPTPTPSPVTTVCSSLQSGATTGFGSFNVTSANTTTVGFCSAGSTGSPTLYCSIDGNWNFDSLSGSCVTISSSLNVGAIVGGIVGGLVALALLVLLLWFLRSRYWNKKDVNSSDYTKPMIPMTSSQSQRSVSQISDLNQSRSGTSTSSLVLNRQADDIYISFNSLKLGAVLGQGHFGQVYQANYTGAQVAVKKSKGIDEKLILEEATMMKNLPPHPNVLHYYGVSQENDEFMMVTELCDKGNLAQYLRNPKNNLTSQQCRQFCRQIASGMWHISKYGVIHRDLRAENILLSGDTKLVAKVADFGLSRSLQSLNEQTNDSAYYRMAELKPIPVAWTAPEVMNNSLKYVAASDVWSFGVVMWEIYSHGAKPFEGIAVQVVVEMIRDPIRSAPLLVRPNKCPDDIFAIMQSCWAFNPQDRPTFEQLYNQLS